MKVELTKKQIDTLLAIINNGNYKGSDAGEIVSLKNALKQEALEKPTP